MTAPELYWLPEVPDWNARAAALGEGPAWEALVALAQARMDFLRTAKLDRIATAATGAPGALRIAVLGSSTVDHLLAGLRVAGLRRGLKLETYVPA